MTAIKINNLTKQITVTVELRGLKVLAWRFWAASFAFRLGAWISGVNVVINPPIDIVPANKPKEAT